MNILNLVRNALAGPESVAPATPPITAENRSPSVTPASPPPPAPAVTSPPAAPATSVGIVAPENSMYSESLAAPRREIVRAKLTGELESVHDFDRKMREAFDLAAVEGSARIRREIIEAEEAARKARGEGTFEHRYRQYVGPEGWLGNLPPIILRLVIESDHSLDPLIRDTAAKLEPFCKKFEEVQQELGKANINAGRELFKKIKADNFAAAERGDFAAIRELPDQDLIAEQIQHRRIVLREAQKLASRSCAPLIFEIGERVQLAARAFAERLLAEEQATAKRFGVQFKPSQQLCMIIGAGCRFAEYVKERFVPETRPDPRHFLSEFLPPVTQAK